MAARPPCLLLTPLLLAALLSGACLRPAGAPSPEPGRARPLVVTSFTVLADLIQQVGRERVEVRALVPSGADPNTYQPAQREVLTVASAALVVTNGLGLDRPLRALVANAARPDLPIVTLSDGLPTLDSGLVAPDPVSPSRGNPYLWLDPRWAIVYVERIRAALAQVDPAGAADYAAAAADYSDRLRGLDREVEQQLAPIPAEERKLVTLHDAFPYLAQRYRLELVGVVIKTPGRAPSAREVADVSRTMQQGAVRTVFTEPQLDARLLKLAARDAGLRIGTLYSDTLDPTVPSYEALLRYNARQLVNGLS
jgi:manganese/iron transport system substrate-binding protein